MTVEWDLLKAKLNFRKHGILFADAVPALEDEFAISVRDHRDSGEERWVAICCDAQMRLLVVVYA